MLCNVMLQNRVRTGHDLARKLPLVLPPIEQLVTVTKGPYVVKRNSLYYSVVEKKVITKG